MSKKPVILCILDGWGFRAQTDGNAIELAPTPNWHRLLNTYPHALIEASGEFVGLPKGQMGNSEVGHTNLGAGRIVMQLLGQIEKDISENALIKNKNIQTFINSVKSKGGAVHLWGLLSDGGVHSHISHIVALAKAIKEANVPLYIHTVTDGRDTDPKSGLGFLKELKAAGLTPATIIGRYFAMDRNNNEDRTLKAAQAITDAIGTRFQDPLQALQASYDNGVTDEFVEPLISEDYKGIGQGDGILIANFRADRVRQIAQALIPHFENRLGMAEYSDELNSFYPAIYPAVKLAKIFGEVIAENGLKQLRIAETEKYAHVTFFFNGGEEKQFDGEERILIPSPAVATYDLAPEMSANEITDQLERVIGEGKTDVIIVNYANGDMVGHTGILEAAEKAAVALDNCLARLEKAVLGANGAMLITADHGNVEKMTDERGNPFTAHTTSPVECVAIGCNIQSLRSGGALCDIAPTLLKILGIDKPKEMTGTSLF